MDTLEKRQRLAEVIKKYRERRRMTQLELAEKSFCTQATITRIEAGKFSPRMEQLYLILDALGLELRVGGDLI